jgi:ribosomal protein S27E
MPVPAESWNRDSGVRCRVCGETVRVAVFPAIERARAGALPEALEADTEASCFYHPASRAAVPCDQCGRFLCRLCELEIDSRHLCPVCFEKGLASNQLEVVETSRTMYDTIALALATFPVPLFWAPIVCAPAALYVVIRRWRAPGSVVPRTRVRYYLAALLALAEIAGIGFLIFVLIAASNSRRRNGTP